MKAPALFLFNLMKGFEGMKTIITKIYKIVFKIISIHFLSAATLDRWTEHKVITYNSAKIKEPLEGYTIAFLTDIHEYPYMRLKHLVSEINQRKVNLVILGGDYSEEHDLKIYMNILSKLKTTDGIYGVEGNHDNYEELKSAMQTFGMGFLDNEGLHIRDNLYIAGIRDLRKHRPNIKMAIKGSKPGDFVLLTAHNPDISMKKDLSGVDLMLSGHTHGGEITFLGLWAPALYFVSDYGQRFREGFSKSKQETDVFVSHGIGMSSSGLFRMFSRPQVIYLKLSNTK